MDFIEYARVNSASINYYKRTEGGLNTMCKAVEEYAQNVANKRANDTIKNLLSAGKLSIEEIAYAVSEPVEKIKAMANEMNSKK